MIQNWRREKRSEVMLRCFPYSNYHALDECIDSAQQSVPSSVVNPQVDCSESTGDPNTRGLQFQEQSNSDGSSSANLLTASPTESTSNLRPLTSSRAPNSMPSSSVFTPELKRPPNQKFVKHLEANLLKNSGSDSQLKQREERYVRVPLGVSAPIRTSVGQTTGQSRFLTEKDRLSISQSRKSRCASLTKYATALGTRQDTNRMKMAPSNVGGATGGNQKTWLHQDNEILGCGVCYTVKYIGCLEVLTSMKSLDFETRTLIAKECIIKVCEAAGLRSIDKKRKQDRRLQRILAEKPVMENAGANVTLRVSASSLALTDIETSQVVATHAMPNISFASGGDQETMDFVAYVGKDDRHNRACFVLECEGGLAQNVIATIGQAFELRFREFMRRSPIPQAQSLPKDPEYYNDLPGKIPPEPPKASSTSNNNASQSCAAGQNNNLACKPGAPDNLIEFDSSLEATNDLCSVPPIHDYVNTNLDPFDMMPMSEVLPPSVQIQATSENPPPADVVASIEQRLQKETWYHGAISRSESEALLKKDGDFLVRESKGQRGQFVLTGLQGGTGKHLLLIDPNGVVRTKERTFESVTHLIHFHRDNQLPIISADSALLLVNPICKT